MNEKHPQPEMFGLSTGHTGSHATSSEILIRIGPKITSSDIPVHANNSGQKALESDFRFVFKSIRLVDALKNEKSERPQPMHLISTLHDFYGWAAALLTLLAFSCNNIVRLRYVALTANAAFIAYGFSAQLWPVFFLHAVLIPSICGA